MKWFRRLACAALLSALFASALTFAAWPRPRFVVALPAMAAGEGPDTARAVAIAGATTDGGAVGLEGRWPWLGFRIASRQPDQAVAESRFWFVNLEDGRTAGPWGVPNVRAFDWDCRGSAVVTTRPLNDPFGPGTTCRLNPATGHLTPIADDRASDFVLSRNGETLLTFARAVTDHGDPDYVCFDLTVDPPTRTPIGLPVPAGSRPRAGGVALSPDGRTLAVAELWRGPERVGEAGVSLFDTRTGRRRLVVAADSPPGAGSFRLTFTNDSRRLRLHVGPPPQAWWPLVAADNRDKFAGLGPPRDFDAETGAVLPQTEPLPDWSANTYSADDGTRRVAFDRDATWPERFRVVRYDGHPLCDWRPTHTEDGHPRLGPRNRFVPGTTGLTWTQRWQPPKSWLEARLGKFLRLPVPAATDQEVDWYDWATDRQWTVGVYTKAERVIPRDKRLVVLGSRGPVEVWDAPPPRRPGHWSIPAGIALGVLVTAAGVGMRRRGRRLSSG